MALAKRKRLHSVREKTRASIRNMQQNGGNVRDSLEDDPNLSEPLQNSRPNAVAGSEKPSKVDMFVAVDVGSSKERRPGSDVSPPLISSPIDKVETHVILLCLCSSSFCFDCSFYQDGNAMFQKAFVSFMWKSSFRLISLSGRMWSLRTVFLTHFSSTSQFSSTVCSFL